jgi:transposase
MTKLAHWYKNVEYADFKNYNILLTSITFNYHSIINYFDSRSTNASAESFSAKIKAFRSQFTGVRNIDFFLFRLSNLFAYPQIFHLIQNIFTNSKQKTT